TLPANTPRSNRTRRSGMPFLSASPSLIGSGSAGKPFSRTLAGSMVQADPSASSMKTLKLGSSACSALAESTEAYGSIVGETQTAAVVVVCVRCSTSDVAPQAARMRTRGRIFRIMEAPFRADQSQLSDASVRTGRVGRLARAVDDEAAAGVPLER